MNVLPSTAAMMIAEDLRLDPATIEKEIFAGKTIAVVKTGKTYRLEDSGLVSVRTIS